MKKQMVWKKFAGVAGALSLLVLAACGQETAEAPQGDATGNGATTADAPEVEGALQVNLPVSSVDGEGLFVIDHTTIRNAVTNNADVIDGGILNFVIAQNQPPAGVMSAFFGTAAVDSQIRMFFEEAMYQVGSDLTMNQEGVATWTLSEDGHTFTFTINENARWSDGEPVTARDWQFGFEVLASPDYTGQRFDSIQRNVVGIVDFNEGNADEISGIRVLDDRTLEIEFINATPSLMAGAIWPNALPYHRLGNIPVAELEDHPYIRETPIGFGPFILDSIVPGEQWNFVRNEYYWRGRPVLDGVNVRIVSNDVIAQEIASGTVDIVNGFAASQVPYYLNELTNVEWIGVPAGNYGYISFNLGDFIDGEVIPNDSLVANNVHLRRAIWHAGDWDEIGRRLFSGLTWSADGIIPPALPAFFNSDLERPVASIEAARAELAAGGFIDVDGDGFVEDPDGNPFTLNFFTGSFQSPAQEAHVVFLIQQWTEAGINVELHTPEFNNMLDMLNENSPEIDMVMMAWGLGWDVDPTQRYGRFSSINRARYVSDELDELLAAINTTEAMDINVRRAAMDAWQEYMLENVVVIPTTNSHSLLPVNNRVQNFDLGTIGQWHGAGGGFWYQVGLSSETGIVNGQ